MKMPNGWRAIVDEAKLVDYCLSFAHPRGRHKARVFRDALGLTADRAAVLRDALLAAAISADAVDGEADSFGQRYVFDFEMTGPAGSAAVRSAWIIRTGEDAPRLVTCYVL